MTEDGFETTFQVNHLAHFYLVDLLKPVIMKSTPARVVHVASIGHRFEMWLCKAIVIHQSFFFSHGQFSYDKVTWNYFSPTNPNDIQNAMTVYNRSKFCNVLFSNELQRRWGRKGVTSNSLHPGVVRTQIVRNSFMGRFIFRLPFFGRERVITMVQYICNICKSVKTQAINLLFHRIKEPQPLYIVPLLLNLKV